MIRRIEIDEVALAGSSDHFLEWLRCNFNVCEHAADCLYILHVDNFGIFIAPERNLELTLSVNAIEPVEAGLVEEYNACCPFHRSQI